jgi:hypothetical protein
LERQCWGLLLGCREMGNQVVRMRIWDDEIMGMGLLDLHLALGWFGVLGYPRSFVTCYV